MENGDGYILDLDSRAQTNTENDHIESIIVYNAEQNAMNNSFDVTLVSFIGARTSVPKGANYDLERDCLII